MLTHSRRAKADLTGWLHKWLIFFYSSLFPVICNVNFQLQPSRGGISLSLILILGWTWNLLVNSGQQKWCCVRFEHRLYGSFPKFSWYDEVQNILSQIRVTWHTEYFKLKESEKCEGYCDLLPHCPSSLKQVINPNMEDALPISKGKEHPYVWRQSGVKKNPNFIWSGQT